MISYKKFNLLPFSIKGVGSEVGLDGLVTKLWLKLPRLPPNRDWKLIQESLLVTQPLQIGIGNRGQLHKHRHGNLTQLLQRNIPERFLK